MRKLSIALVIGLLTAIQVVCAHVQPHIRAHVLPHTMQTPSAQRMKVCLPGKKMDTEVLAKIMILVSGSMLLVDFQCEDIAYFIASASGLKCDS